MPELPDVEVYRRQFDAEALNQQIEQVRVSSASVLSGVSASDLEQALRQQKFISSRHHGKYLLALLDNGKCVAMHFGMTGWLAYLEQNASEPNHTRLAIQFENGKSVAYVSSRRLGHVYLAESPEGFVQDKKLGEDALEMDESAFVDLATGQRAGIKSWLMDQHIIAGIGNVYADEVLFQVGVHPRCAVGSLDRTQLRKLFQAIRSVLSTAIEHGGDRNSLPSSYLIPRRKAGRHCPRCDSPVKQIKVAGRTTWYCPGCQSEDNC